MEKAVELLFFDRLSDKEIARHCDVARSTLACWKNLPEFQDALQDFGRQQRLQAYTLLESGSEQAVRTLLDLLDSDNENIRLKSAVELLRLTTADQPPLVSDIKRANPSKEITQFLALITKKGMPDSDHGD